MLAAVEKMVVDLIFKGKAVLLIGINIIKLPLLLVLSLRMQIILLVSIHPLYRQ